MPDPNNIVDSKTKTAWLCVPKNANTSIKTALRQWLNMPLYEDTYRHHNNDFTFVSTKRIATEFKHYLRIAVARNPYARLASAWKYTCADSPGWWESIPYPFGMYSNMPFAEFVSVACKQEDREMNIHYRPQSSMLLYKHQPAYDILCRMETLGEDWKKVQEKVDIPDLERHRVSGARWKEMYTPELFDQVRYRYAEDVLRFGYEDEKWEKE